MFPDLSYIIHFFFGLEPDNGFSIVKTFGLFLALAILGAAYFFNLELKRKAKEGLFKPRKEKITLGKPASLTELITNGIFGFVIGFKLLYIFTHGAEMAADASGVILSGKGSWLGGILGALLFAGIKYWEKKRQELPKPKVQEVDVYPHTKISDLTILAAVSGVVGAKLFAILEDVESFMVDPIGNLFSGGGLAIYGGLIVAFAVCYWYLKRRDIPPIHVMDAVAPALIIGYGIGRLGCHFSGDGDWGIVNALATPDWWFLPDWLWAYSYPHNVLNEGVMIEGCTWKYCAELAPPVYPTAIYESIMAFAIGGILWGLRKRITIPGVLFFIYLIFNGIERFFIEKIRVNTEYDWFYNWTQAEIISVILTLVGIGGCLILWRRNKVKTA